MTGPDDPSGHDLLGRRWFTPVFLVRRWQIEKNRGEHAGEFEEPGVTPERLEALRRLVQEPGLRATLAEAGPRRAALFSWPAAAAAVEAAYALALENSRLRS